MSEEYLTDDEVRATYLSPYYASPVDGHDHFTVQGRRECQVCRLETERDRLRIVASAAQALLTAIDEQPLDEMDLSIAEAADALAVRLEEAKAEPK